MPIVRIKPDGPLSFTYGPTRREFIKGVDYVMADIEARDYTDVRDLEVERPLVPRVQLTSPIEPPLPSRPVPPQPSPLASTPIPAHPEPNTIPVSTAPRRRGRPPKMR